jgi:hypothetical protein
MPDDPRMTDTTKEAVERLAALYADAAKAGSNAPFPSHAHTAATLRALLAERDAARAKALEEAARAVEGMRPCPFDKGGDVARGVLAIEPHQPCPVCGDRGDDPDASVNCRSPAAAIRALAEPQR